MTVFWYCCDCVTQVSVFVTCVSLLIGVFKRVIFVLIGAVHSQTSSVTFS